MPSVLVGVAGAATMVDRSGAGVELAAPFVIDLWAADDRRVAFTGVIATAETTLLLVDWSARDVVFTAAPRLRRLSEAARRETVDSATESTVDLVDVSHPVAAPARS